VLLFSLSFSFKGFAAGIGKFNGTWVLIPGKSSDIELFKKLELNIREKNQNLLITYKWEHFHDFLMDTLQFDGKDHITKKKRFPNQCLYGIENGCWNGNEIDLSSR